MFYGLLVFCFVFQSWEKEKKINLPCLTCTPFPAHVSSCRACWGVPEGPEWAHGKSPTRLSSELKLGLHSLFTVQLQTLKRLISSHKCRFLFKIERQHSRPQELQQQWEEGGEWSSCVSGEHKGLTALQHSRISWESCASPACLRLLWGRIIPNRNCSSSPKSRISTSEWNLPEDNWGAKGHSAVLLLIWTCTGRPNQTRPSVHN